jgi:hypothetical protein
MTMRPLRFSAASVMPPFAFRALPMPAQKEKADSN